MFDQTLLNSTICDKIRADKKNSQYQCTDADLADDKNLVLPQNIPLFTPTQKLLHFTIFFDIFVFLQVFNLINARKIEGELNVFSDFFNNPLFFFIIILTFVVQIFIIEYGH